MHEPLPRAAYEARVEFTRKLNCYAPGSDAPKPRCAILFTRWNVRHPWPDRPIAIAQHILDVIGAHAQNFQECAHFRAVIKRPLHPPVGIVPFA